MSTLHSPVRRSSRRNGAQADRDASTAVTTPPPTTSQATSVNVEGESAIATMSEAGQAEAVSVRQIAQDPHQTGTNTAEDEQTSGWNEARLLARIASLERQLQMAMAPSSGALSRPATSAALPPSLSALSQPATSAALPPSLSTPLQPATTNVPPSLSMPLQPATISLPPSLSMPLQSATMRLDSNCLAITAQPALINATPGMGQHGSEPTINSATSTTPFPSPCVNHGWTLRKIPDLPEFSGQPEDWPIFHCAYTETTKAYNCTDLENNQRLVRALKGDARESVKSLLIHPSNVNAVMSQLCFRYGRPEQLVRSQLQSVREVQPISEYNIMKIVPFATRVSNLAAFLQSINGNQHLANPTMLDELVTKLPFGRRVDWARHAANIKPYPTIVDFSAWLTELANVIWRIPESDNKEHKRRVLHASTNVDEVRVADRTQPCSLCHAPHGIPNCKDFKNASPSARWRMVKKHRLCFSCLSPGHMVRTCANVRVCRAYGCNRTHHQLLHGEGMSSKRTSQPADPQRHYREATPQPADAHRSPTRLQPATSKGRSSPTANERSLPQRNLSCIDIGTKRLLFRILPVTLYGRYRRIETYALLDEGSSVTMIDGELVRDLGLKGESRQLDIQWFGGRSAQEYTKVVSLQISGADTRKRHTLSNVYAVSNLNLPMQTLQRDGLEGANAAARLPMKPYTNAVPKVLIGLDHAHLGLPTKTMEIGRQGPYAAATELGWVVFGPLDKRQNTPMPQPCLFVRHQDDEVHRMVNEYLEVESFGAKAAQPIPAADDVRAQRILDDTTVKLGGRYQTGLIWKRDNVILPPSYQMALKRLTNMEKKMSRDTQFAQAYRGMIEDYVRKGYARRLDPEEATAASGGKHWYLPHFAVTNPNKPGKIRLVFDAAARVGNVSLNSELLKGPQHYKPLTAVLFHFREGAFAVSGDIKEMFHQIYVQPQDRCAQRFLWRDGDQKRDVDVYEMQVMTFGAACSPSAAHHVMTLNALRYKHTDPRAVKAITDFHYVDDYVDSFATEGEAISVSARVREIHSNGGFELCRFTSNSAEVVRRLGQHEAYGTVEWKEADEKILGMYWQPATDEFKFNVKHQRLVSDVPTKRQFLSLLMSTFDPIGFLSCVMITAKLLLREIWRRDIPWDEPLPMELSRAIEKWRQELSKADQFRCCRYYFGAGVVKSTDLHMFVDASQSAIAAVAYWRTTYHDGEVRVRFVCAKTKCAPMKTMSVPRLELQAAVLGTRLLNAVKEGHSVVTDGVTLWTDAKTVLRWIGSSHRRYKQYVGNRVAEILESTSITQWRWVPSAYNVADEATRPQKQVDFSQNSRWLCGPEFLQQPEAFWPQPAAEVESSWTAMDDEELPCEFALVVTNESFIEFQRFSNYNRLLRTIAWVLRFVRHCRQQWDEMEQHGLTAAECEGAELLLVRCAQVEMFANELHDVLNNKAVSQSSDIRGLLPYLDDEAILRASGRIDAAMCLPYGARRPIILSHRHPLTELIVRHYHTKMKHQNVDATITEIRTKFWITRMRRVLQRVVWNCGVCKLQRVKPKPPLMGPLPEDRLQPGGWPFEYTGLDYFGPLLVTVGRRKEKRWVALFTCLKTRAVHLELAHDLSTDSCILVIRNFACRRGPVTKLRSDNGRNFVGANGEARRFTEVFEPERIQNEMSARHIEWIFNCPLNPAEGGVWERMVQCVKRVLRHTVKEVAPKEHVLQSFLIEAENVVNSRPLTHLPITIDQEAPLTPNDLLRGTANVPDTPGVGRETPKPCETRKQWRMARLLRDRFWKRWVCEYLPTLVRREKWCARTEPIKKDDVVFVCDPAVPRREWRMGIVEAVYTGVDGTPRRATVRTMDKDRVHVVIRPVSKLAVLDVMQSLHGGGDVAGRDRKPIGE